MEEIRCPNPKCRRRILDDEGKSTEAGCSTAGIPCHAGGHPCADGAEDPGGQVEGNQGTFAEVRRGEALGGEAGGLPGADAGSAGAVMGRHALLKLVEGRSNRKYTDEEEVAQAAQKAGYTDIYKKTLIGITEMERLLGKKKFAEILGKLVYKPQGKVTLVPESDKRQEIAAATAEADFKEE